MTSMKKLLVVLALMVSFWIPTGTGLHAQNISGGTVNTVYSTGSYTNATTTFSNVTGLTFTAAASTNYHGICYITWQGSAGTTGPKYQFTGPSSPTSVFMYVWSWVTASTFAPQAVVAAFSTPFANAGAVTSATNFTDTVVLTLQNGANAGAVQLQMAANGAGTLTVQNSSFCNFQ